MNKPNILISIQPAWIEKIFNKIKVIDVRKTKPKVEPPFKCLIYCVNNRSVVLDSDWDMKKFWTNTPAGTKHFYNGKVVGEFICDKIDSYIHKAEDGNYYWSFSSAEHIREIKQQTCLTVEQLIKYAGDNNFLYGWHISELKIYDKPKELIEFYKPIKYDNVCGTRVVHCGHYQGLETVDSCEYNDGDCSLKGCKELRNLYQIKRPPQSWCYVEE